jgi:hypothetical protein
MAARFSSKVKHLKHIARSLVHCSRKTGSIVKVQIALCLLLLTGTSLAADQFPLAEPTTAPPSVEQVADASVASQGILPVAAQSPSAETFTAPPIVIGPNGQPAASQYQPPIISQPGIAQPGLVQPGMGPQPVIAGPPVDAYGRPLVGPYGAAPIPPGGLVNPVGIEPIIPYKALTPDITMAPTTTNGPLPDRYGWTQRYDFSYLPTAATRENAGNFSDFEFDLAWKYIQPLYPYGLIFSFTQQYDLRLLNGPDTQWWNNWLVLPGALHRIGWDFELKTADPGPWNMVVGFNPAIASDFEKSLSRNAWNWDGRIGFIYSPSRELAVVLGVLFWDRITERVLPWGGVIYRPNRYWQLDLTFPQLRVSTYMWDECGSIQTSLYYRLEYHSEAYEIYNPMADHRDRVELTDWRSMIGVNKDMGTFAYFFEGGWIFGRNVDFKYAPAGFDVSSGAIVRAGLRY